MAGYSTSNAFPSQFYLPPIHCHAVDKRATCITGSARFRIVLMRDWNNKEEDEVHCAQSIRAHSHI